MWENLDEMIRSFFIALSTNKSLRRVMEESSVGRALSRRFVAGLTVDEAVAASKELNAQGLAVSLDALGENVHTVEEAQLSAGLYVRLLDAIAADGLNANVSLKLTQMGIDLSEKLAEEIVGGLVERANAIGTFVRIDMEGTPYTQTTVEMTRRLSARNPGAVGTVLQAYLYRTADDAKRLTAEGIRIRLCKGAYKEAASLAFQDKTDTDRNYVTVMQQLLESGVFCGIATHDEAIVHEAKSFAASKGIDRQAFEFQMLYGIRRDLQRSLVAEGYRVRIYVPFGPEWYPYFMRRLAERPANVIFVLKNLLKR